MSKYTDTKEVKDMVQTAVERLTSGTATVRIEALAGKHDAFRIVKLVEDSNTPACFEVRIHPVAWR